MGEPTEDRSTSCTQAATLSVGLAFRTGSRCWWKERKLLYRLSVPVKHPLRSAGREDSVKHSSSARCRCRGDERRR